MLRRSNNWLFLGYSLPSYDFDVASILRRAVEARNGCEVACIVDPAAESVAKRLTPIIGEDVDVLEFGFSTFVDACLESAGSKRFEIGIPP